MNCWCGCEFGGVVYAGFGRAARKLVGWVVAIAEGPPLYGVNWRSEKVSRNAGVGGMMCVNYGGRGSN